MAEARIIYNPGKLVMNMFYRKMNQESRKELAERKYDAVGLFQTTVAAHYHAGILRGDRRSRDGYEDGHSGRKREEESSDLIEFLYAPGRLVILCIEYICSGRFIRDDRYICLRQMIIFDKDSDRGSVNMRYV